MVQGLPSEIFESMSALKRSLRALATQAYASLDLGLNQGKFLRYIGRHGGTSQAGLARATETDPTLAGRVLETLVERGLVRRKRSETDRRQYVLELTGTGKRLVLRLEELRGRIAERVAQVLDERDVEDFERITAKLRAAFGRSPCELPDAQSSRRGED
jgi:DNA-binding MarR family transcriptional regulator